MVAALSVRIGANRHGTNRRKNAARDRAFSEILNGSSNTIYRLAINNRQIKALV
jgi:hypothetical protein